MTGTRLIVDEDTRTPGDFKRRKSDGAPYVSDPDGAVVKTGKNAGEPRMIVQRRASSLGKNLGDPAALIAHAVRHAVYGTAIDPEILADAQALARLDTNDVAFRIRGDELAERAQAAGGGFLKRDRGSHVHALTEAADRGEDIAALIPAGEALGLTADVQHAIVATWRQLLDQYGLEVVAIEATTHSPAIGCAGRLDRHVRLTRNLWFGTLTGDSDDDKVGTGQVRVRVGTVAVLDLKTGSLRREASIQILGYATGDQYDPDTLTRSPWPYDVSTDWGFIAQIDVKAAIDGEARASLVLVDLAAGRHGAELVAAVDAWEARTDIFTIDPDAIVVPVTTTTDNKEPDHEGDDQYQARKAPGPDVTVAGAAHDDGRRTASDDGAGAVAGVLVSGRGDGPAAPTRAEQLAALPHGAPDEGPDADPATIAAVEANYSELGADARKWIGELSTSAANWNVPFSMSAASNQPRTARRLAIIAGLVRMCHADAADDDTLRSLLALTVSADWPLFPNVQPGHALGVLGATEAAQFAAHAEAFNRGSLVLTVDDNGTARFGVAA